MSRVTRLLVALCVISVATWGCDSPDERLINAAEAGSVRGIQDELAKGADINYTDEGGFTALSSAAINGNRDVVLFLISRGADPTIKNQDGKTALQETQDSEIRKSLQAYVTRFKSDAGH